jgi:hypothetical protein
MSGPAQFSGTDRYVLIDVFLERIVTAPKPLEAFGARL